MLIVGAGFIGVEWATEIDYFFKDITVTLCDMLPKCLGPLPDPAKDYCQSSARVFIADLKYYGRRAQRVENPQKRADSVSECLPIASRCRQGCFPVSAW